MSEKGPSTSSYASISTVANTSLAVSRSHVTVVQDLTKLPVELTSSSPESVKRDPSELSVRTVPASARNNPPLGTRGFWEACAFFLDL